MEIYPVTPVFFALATLCAVGGLPRLLMFTAAMLPFGMLAAIGLPAVGGLSLIGANMAVAILLGVGSVMLTTKLMRGQRITVQPATLALLLFTLYAMFSATVLVRLFAGEMMVFGLSRGTAGVRVSTAFSWEKVWLGPGNSNISQTFYIVLAFGLFVVAAHVLRQRGTGFGRRCLALAATLNIVLGTLDLIGLDPLLSFIRTANYSLANSATVQGVPRVIGGFSEAASFGAASAMFFAFFAGSFLDGARWRDGALAAGNLLFAGLALSSTGIIAAAAVCCVLIPLALSRVPRQVGRPAALALIVAVGLAGCAFAALLLGTEAPTLISSVLEDLILDKSQSSSGQERTAWALGGLEAMRDSYGLGVGVGSMRSNGLIFVLLGSVGIIGTLTFLAFLWLAFGGRAAEGEENTLLSVRLAAMAVLISMLLAATVPDPGVQLTFLAALAVACRAPRRADLYDDRILDGAADKSTA